MFYFPQAEQRDILSRMNFNLWPNIAHNGALLENVFVMFVCILNRIPVFVVGKPGNSKSLAIQLLDSSLRSDSSQDRLLRYAIRLVVVMSLSSRRVHHRHELA